MKTLFLALLLTLTACGTDHKEAVEAPNNVTLQTASRDGILVTNGFEGGPANCPIFWPKEIPFEIYGDGRLDLGNDIILEPIQEHVWTSSAELGSILRTTTISLLEDDSINIKVVCTEK